ncbi:Hypoxanthine phosphoribosyltransferase [Raoultella terrigena]|uniref:Hypoxanthine phosphoribosyltransferase n=1 Tax=Raoultella terrigena TaxID=577 RepID=A0A4U9D671_RAOTE|nr:Hypoxanthine phosphoribosyltransferase [Raoultella terrigena]
MIYLKNQMVSFMKHTVEVMIPEAEIKARNRRTGSSNQRMLQRQRQRNGVGGAAARSFMFMADLCREVQVPHEVDFMTASSYGSGMSTTRDVKILKDLDEDIRGKDVPDRGRHHRLRQHAL